MRRSWIVALVALTATACGGTATEADTIFSWSRGDLGEWMTEDEMTDALHTVLGVDGRAVLHHEADGWMWWEYAGHRISAHDGDHDGDGVVDTDLTKTDPRLPDGVVYEAAWGFAYGSYLLSGPNSEASLCMEILPPGVSAGYPAESEVEAYEDTLFSLASIMLHEMGWTD